VDRYNAATERIYSTIYGYPKPTIAAIEGYCIGGGLNLAVACDLRFCTQGSRFALPAARLGLGYGFAGLQRFINTIGPSYTKDIFFSARQFGVEEALQMGLVNRVVADGGLATFVKDYADGVAANAPLTVGAVKQITTEVLKPEGERNLARAAELVARCFASQDYVEGRTAFMEKRKPNFTGK
jgi:enoyl-CoA hydratase/carnithine racemase